MKQAYLTITMSATIFFSACGVSTKSDQSATASIASENAIVNFHTVTDDLFRSGNIKASDISILAGLHVKTILSLEDEGGSVAQANVERDAATSRHIRYIWQPWSPSQKPTLEEINTALDVIMDPNNAPLLVHCKHGSDRTGIAIAAYRIRHDHWTKARAIAEMKSYGHTSTLYWWDTILDQVH